LAEDFFSTGIPVEPEVATVISTRAAQGGPALLAAWGSDDPGAPPAPPAPALSVLDHAGPGGDPFALIAEVPFDRLAEARPIPLFHALPEVAARLTRATASASRQADLLAALGAAGNREEAADLLLGLLRAETAAALGHLTADAVTVEANLLDLGFSSFTAQEMSDRLHTATGLRIPAVTLFDHRTLASLADRLLDELEEVIPDQDPVPAPSA
ncbi:MAG TPA: acyl carrier protein, partial [Actinocrinis sp.]